MGDAERTHRMAICLIKTYMGGSCKTVLGAKTRLHSSGAIGCQNGKFARRPALGVNACVPVTTSPASANIRRRTKGIGRIAAHTIAGRISRSARTGQLIIEKSASCQAFRSWGTGMPAAAVLQVQPPSLFRNSSKRIDPWSRAAWGRPCRNGSQPCRAETQRSPAGFLP